MVTPLMLFGAGASYGSDTQGTPPLGSGLFDALQIFSRETWGQVSAGEAEVFTRDFEQGMKAYTESPPAMGPWTDYSVPWQPISSDSDLEPRAYT
jgi:hypothetical protein